MKEKILIQLMAQFHYTVNFYFLRWKIKSSLKAFPSVIEIRTVEAKYCWTKQSFHLFNSVHLHIVNLLSAQFIFLLYINNSLGLDVSVQSLWVCANVSVCYRIRLHI